MCVCVRQLCTVCAPAVHHVPSILTHRAASKKQWRSTCSPCAACVPSAGMPTLPRRAHPAQACPPCPGMPTLPKHGMGALQDRALTVSCGSHAKGKGGAGAGVHRKGRGVLCRRGPERGGRGEGVERTRPCVCVRVRVCVCAGLVLKLHTHPSCLPTECLPQLAMCVRTGARVCMCRTCAQAVHTPIVPTHRVLATVGHDPPLCVACLRDPRELALQRDARVRDT